jgi:hypothetical protein
MMSSHGMPPLPPVRLLDRTLESALRARIDGTATY